MPRVIEEPELIRNKMSATRRAAKDRSKAKSGSSTILDYPLLSGKSLRDARSASPAKEAGIEKEMASIVKEISTTGIDKFVLAKPEKAWRLVVYLARRIQL